MNFILRLGWPCCWLGEVVWTWLFGAWGLSQKRLCRDSFSACWKNKMKMYVFFSLHVQKSEVCKILSHFFNPKASQQRNFFQRFSAENLLEIKLCVYMFLRPLKTWKPVPQKYPFSFFSESKQKRSQSWKKSWSF